jgi:hypothetical protein
LTRILPAFAVLLLFGFLILLWKDWPQPLSQAGFGDESAGAAGTQIESAPDPLARLKPPPERETFASVIERPIFRPDRKPEPPPDEEQAASATPETNAQLDTMDLTGVLITPAIVSAWVKDPAQPKLRRVRIGDDFEGWSVREILEDRVLLERQGEEYALILRDYSKESLAAAPAPVPRRTPRLPKGVPPAPPTP